METVEDLRDEIDGLDNQIISFLEKRQRIVKQIQRIKAEKGLDPKDEDREQQILDKIERQADVAQDELKELYAGLFDSARGKEPRSRSEG